MISSLSLVLPGLIGCAYCMSTAIIVVNSEHSSLPFEISKPILNAPGNEGALKLYDRPLQSQGWWRNLRTCLVPVVDVYPIFCQKWCTHPAGCCQIVIFLGIKASERPITLQIYLVTGFLELKDYLVHVDHEECSLRTSSKVMSPGFTCVLIFSSQWKWFSGLGLKAVKISVLTSIKMNETKPWYYGPYQLVISECMKVFCIDCIFPFVIFCMFVIFPLYIPSQLFMRSGVVPLY